MRPKKTDRRPRTTAKNQDRAIRDLLIRELQDLYGADEQLIGAFSRFARLAYAKPVAKLCREGVDYSKERVRRLDQSFSILGMKPRGKRSDGMGGLIRHGLKRAREEGPKAATDAALMTCIQQISFYGLAGYDAACTYARVLGETGCLKILRASLREKRDAVAEEATILKGLLR